MEWRRRDSELGRSAVKEPRRRGEEKPPFVDGFSDFLTGLQDLFWQSESHMGRATTSNLLLASPTTSLCACPPPPTSAVAGNLAKIPGPEQTAATHHHLLVHVGQAQVTIGHNVTSKASNHSWLQATTKPRPSPYSWSPENSTQVAVISLSPTTMVLPPFSRPRIFGVCLTPMSPPLLLPEQTFSRCCTHDRVCRAS